MIGLMKLPNVLTKRENGIEVTIWPQAEMWEYYNEYEDVYLSGYLCLLSTQDEVRVLGFDGCYVLPDEVKQFLEEQGFVLDVLF